MALRPDLPLQLVCDAEELSKLRREVARLRQERDEYLDQLLAAHARERRHRPPDPEESAA